MRKLTVKNFSVIKEAELEFGKITVLIGPQSSGKSLLCKLAYFLSKEVLEYAVASLMGGISLDEFKVGLVHAFQSRFFNNGWLKKDSSAEFVANRYSVRVFGAGDFRNPDIFFNLSPDFESLYTNLLMSQPDRDFALVQSRQDQQDEVWTQLNLLLSAPFVCESLYVPAGRAFFTDTSKGFSALQNTDIDPLIRQFASEIAWGDRWRVGLTTAGDDVLEEIRKTMIRIAQGQVVVTTNFPSFLGLDGRYISLALLSSGTQELLPLFNVLDRLASLQEHREVSRNATRTPPFDRPPVGSKKLIYLEEPEANVFPSTQYELVRLFARLSHEPRLDFSWVITTHSPYILTAFNDLIKAGHIAAQRPDKAEEIEKIVPRQYWIKPSDFAAYAFDGKDGILHPIMDDETKMINGDVLDDISETISGEFGQLLEIQYGD